MSLSSSSLRRGLREVWNNPEVTEYQRDGREDVTRAVKRLHCSSKSSVRHVDNLEVRAAVCHESHLNLRLETHEP